LRVAGQACKTKISTMFVRCYEAQTCIRHIEKFAKHPQLTWYKCLWNFAAILCV